MGTWLSTGWAGQRMRTVALTLAMFAASLGIVRAQQMSEPSTDNPAILKISPLRDLRVFNLIIEDLPPAAAKCGITSGKLDASLRSMLARSKIQLVESTVQNKIYLNVNVLDSCASAFDLKVISPATVVANGQTDLSAAIWDTGGLRAGGNPSQDTVEQIENGVKQLLDEWNLENQ